MAYEQVKSFQTTDGILHSTEESAIRHDLKNDIFYTLAGDEPYKAAELCFDHVGILLPLLTRIAAMNSENTAVAKRTTSVTVKEGIPPSEATLLSASDKAKWEECLDIEPEPTPYTKGYERARNQGKMGDNPYNITENQGWNEWNRGFDGYHAERQADAREG